MNFSDPVQLYRAHLSASYSPSPDLPGSQEVHLEAALSRPGWTASALYNPADFYDLFGPTLRSRKGYAFGLAHNRMFVYDPPRQVDLTVDATYWGGLDTLPDYQNVAAPVSTLLSVTARLRGRNVRSSLGHVDDEKGIEWSSVVDQSLVQGKGYFRTWAGVDLGAALPLGHSSLWLRSSAGFSPGDPDQPYSNFFFGGFGNNWVDHGNEKRYREQYAFPGKPLNGVSGRNYVRTHGGVEPPAPALPARGQARLLPHLGADGGLRLGPGDEPGRLGPAPRGHERGRAGGPAVHGALGARHDDLRRLRARVRGRRRAAGRGHGLAQGPAVAPPGAGAARLLPG